MEYRIVSEEHRDFARLIVFDKKSATSHRCLAFLFYCGIRLCEFIDWLFPANSDPGRNGSRTTL